MNGQVSAPALDRERLLADLERAAAIVTDPTFSPFSEHGRSTVEFARACRVVAAAIVDGEYDRPSDRIRSLMDELRAAVDEAKRASGQT